MRLAMHKNVYTCLCEAWEEYNIVLKRKQIPSSGKNGDDG